MVGPPAPWAITYNKRGAAASASHLKTTQERRSPRGFLLTVLGAVGSVALQYKQWCAVYIFVI